ncbi:GNAT family N-acetyltransferase [Rhodobium gokarnense]|uniref:GNAT superfamily N-acetyltransferase n=1 Tax=Rhodobium gokarnense TaxID=364296 RepID=A0ABT3H8S0_9HYPH|nr:GNAT family N-acetyltransferase [Rhodobium gokarnense]MCW2306783.1 GNAT superfamily N-acetyltransferase [Rhodobium gokarnense]
MSDEVCYRQMERGQEPVVFSLIQRVFDACVAPHYSPSGVARFYAQVSETSLREKAEDPVGGVFVAAKGAVLVGMVALARGHHIALLFVAPEYQGKGIGRALVALAAERCREIDRHGKTMTVNASPNSVPFYEKADFVPASGERDDNGLRFTPMTKPMS